MKEKKVIGLDKEGWREEDSHCRFSSNSRQKLSATLEPAACLCNPRFLRASMFFWLARNVRLAAYSGEKKFLRVLSTKEKREFRLFSRWRTIDSSIFGSNFTSASIERERERERFLINQKF